MSHSSSIELAPGLCHSSQSSPLLVLLALESVFLGQCLGIFTASDSGSLFLSRLTWPIASALRLDSFPPGAHGEFVASPWNVYTKV